MSPTKVFSSEFCKIFKNTFLIEHLWENAYFLGVRVRDNSKKVWERLFLKEYQLPVVLIHALFLIIFIFSNLAG